MSIKLQTPIEDTFLNLNLDHSSKMLFLGSCFAENIGAKLKDFKFNLEINPLGISYNPLSLFNLLERSIEEEHFKESDLQFENERYFSFDLHSSFSDPKAEEIIHRANQQLEQQTLALYEADILFISLGTAWVHFLREEKQLVNNCHKIAARKFTKAMLSVQDITDAWERFVKKIQSKNAKIKLVFTVSPVRHIKDGFRENQLSKSTLHLAVDEICRNHEHCHYFPSYEIMMDELRDYRFYDRDLLHPNSLAIDIIWEHFQASCLSEDCRSSLHQLNKLLTALSHRPFNAKSNAHLEFLKKLHADLREFEQQYPIDLKSELIEVQDRIDRHQTS